MSKPGFPVDGGYIYQNFWMVNISQLCSELPAHNVQVTQPRVNSVIKIDIVSIEKKSQMSS